MRIIDIRITRYLYPLFSIHIGYSYKYPVIPILDISLNYDFLKGVLRMKFDELIASSDTVDVYRSGDMAVKLFKVDRPKTQSLYEALTHARVEDTGLNVPIIHEVSVIDGRWAITMDLIKGKTLAEVMAEDPSNMEKYVNDMVDLQMEIHSKQVPKLSKLKDKLARQINSLDQLNDSVKFELLARLGSMPKHTKLCHGNFTPSNIILNEKGTYIVDWLAARQGNASADVARSFLLLSLDYPDIADLYLDTFCKKTGTSKNYVQDWLPIVAAAQLTENRPKEKELLMKWIDVASYE